MITEFWITWALTLKTVINTHSDERVLGFHRILDYEAEIIPGVGTAALNVTSSEKN